MINRIKELRRARGLTQKQLGEMVGTSSQQIGLLENGERQLSQHWMKLLARALHIAPAELLPSEDRVPPPGNGFRENDAETFDPGSTTNEITLAMLAAAKKGRPNADTWVVKTNALDLAGYLPGDLVLIDLNVVDPPAGEVVVAQLYDYGKGTASTVLRIFEPPYLIAASANPAYRKPELIETDRVAIMGTVIALVRPTDLAAA